MAARQRGVQPVPAEQLPQKLVGCGTVDGQRDQPECPAWLIVGHRAAGIRGDGQDAGRLSQPRQRSGFEPGQLDDDGRQLLGMGLDGRARLVGPTRVGVARRP